MKKLLITLAFIALSACTFYPMGMTEAEWNALTPQQRIQMREKEAKLQEERQLRYAIERQNRLKEDRILSENKASESTAQAAAAAASAAQAASQSASAAQQASQNTSTNNITFNPNIVVSNTNQNDLSNISDNTNNNTQNQSNNQNQANSNDSNAGSTANNSGSASANNEGSADNINHGGSCGKKFHSFVKKGEKFMAEQKYQQAIDMYQKAISRACSDEQKEEATTKINLATEALNAPIENSDTQNTAQ